MPYNFRGATDVYKNVAEKTATARSNMKSLFFKNRSQATLVQPKAMPSLAACIVMDLLGMASFGIPILCELIDIVWAPLSALIYLKMFGFKKGMIGGIFNFVEELLPGFDIIPTFTITWVIQYLKQPTETTYSLKPLSRNHIRQL